MKKLFKKSLPLLMAGLMFISSVVPTFATVSENQNITTPSTGITQVYYNQESTFGITIPKLIDLGSDKETNYTVTITGDISSDETILVVPDESFLMKDTNTSSPKDDVTATVTQDKTEWKFNEFSTIGNGNVSAPNLTAGIWEGKFYFNVKLQNCNISVTAKDENGNDLNASATYITGTEKENLLNSLVDSGYVNSTDEVDALINVDSDSFDGIADTTFDVSDTYSEGDTVAILHYNEETKEWEYIGTETVDENGLINGDFTSYSPVAFVKVNSDGSLSHVHNYTITTTTSTCTAAGLKIYTCYCGDTYSEEISSATGHNLVAGECSKCNYSAAGFYNSSGALLYSLADAKSVIEKDYDSSMTTINSLLGNTYRDTTKIIIPEGVVTIGKQAFRDASTSYVKVNKIIMPSTLKTIKSYAFYSNTFVSSYVIPEGVTYIGECAFAMNRNYLKSVTIPNSVTYIGKYAFQQLQVLPTITLPDNLTYLGYGAFHDCNKLTTIIYKGVSYTNVKTLEAALKANGVTYTAGFWQEG